MQRKGIKEMWVVTVKIDKTVKAALDIYAAKEYARTGVSLTNSKTIERLLEQVDNKALSEARAASKQRNDPADQ